MPAWFSALSPVVLGGAIALAVAVVLMALVWRAPRPLSRVFSLLAVSVACPGAALVVGITPPAGPAAWLGVALGAAAAAALAWYLPAVASEFAYQAADHDRLRLLEAAV